MELNRIDIPLLTADQLATYGEIASLYGRGKEARKIPIDKVFVRNNFNHRHDFGDIRSLADYILDGNEVPPISVDILKDGSAVLLEGERRVRAHMLLLEDGHNEFTTIHAFINDRKLTEAERIAKSAASNNNKQFAPLELAELFKDLRDVHGWSNVEIAKATGHNVMHVSNQLRLAGITDEEKELIREGAVSSTAVLDLIKSGVQPSARLDTIKDAAASGGDGQKKGKLKVKDVENMGDLKAAKLEDSDTPETLIKGLLIHVKALDRLIGTDSKMSDITFKIDAELRMLKTLISSKYKLIESNTVAQTVSDFISKAPLHEEPGDLNEKGVDTLFEESAKLVVQEQQASASLLQRRLKIGYARSYRIMQELENHKIIGPFKGSEPQDVLIAGGATLFDHLEIIKSNNSDDGPF